VRESSLLSFSVAIAPQEGTYSLISLGVHDTITQAGGHVHPHYNSNLSTRATYTLTTTQTQVKNEGDTLNLVGNQHPHISERSMPKA